MDVGVVEVLESSQARRTRKTVLDEDFQQFSSSLVSPKPRFYSTSPANLNHCSSFCSCSVLAAYQAHTSCSWSRSWSWSCWAPVAPRCHICSFLFYSCASLH